MRAAVDVAPRHSHCIRGYACRRPAVFDDIDGIIRRLGDPAIRLQTRAPAGRVVLDEAAKHARQVHGDMINLGRAVVNQAGEPITLEQQMIVPHIAQARLRAPRHIGPGPQAARHPFERSRQQSPGAVGERT